MSNAKQTRRLPLPSCETLLHILETLPGALFVIDDADTIVYANASAQALTGATPEQFVGTTLWRCAPHLVSPSLYQAMLKTKETREPTEVEYVSPVTHSWLHVSLSPTDEGLALLFHTNLEPPHLQDALRRNEHMYRDLLESVADGVTIVTPEGLILDINQRPLADAHLRRGEVVGISLTDLPAWSSDPAVQQRLRAAMAQAARGETVRFEARIHPRSNLSLDILMTITPHRDASQQVEYLICAGRDITERKRAEDELRTLVDAIPQFVWMMRPDGFSEYHNRRWCDYTSMTSEQAQGEGWLQSIHPDDRQRILETWQTAIQTGTPYEVEQRLRHGTTGEYRWFLARGAPLKDAQGTILKWFGTSTDIDDRKRAEQRIKASEENWRVLAETVPQLVWTTGPDNRLDYCNQRYCEYTHATFEQLQGHGWRQFLHPEEAEGVVALRHQTLQTGEPYESECRLRNGQTGTYRWFLARGTPVRDETGQIVKWFGTNTDIHDKKQAEEEIRSLVDTIPQLVWMMRPDGFSEYHNRRWCDYTSMTSEQAQGDGWLQSIHPDDRQGALDAWQTSLPTGIPFEREQRLRNGTSGAYRWFLARAMPHKDAQGTTLKWLGTATDIDDRKRAEQRIKASEENWRVLAETLPQLVWTTSPDGFVEYWNQRWYDYIGSFPEQSLGHAWSQFLHPDDYQHTLTVWHHALATGDSYEIEYRLKDGQTGAYRWFLARGTPVRDEAGQIVKWFGTCTDIHEKKQAEDDIRVLVDAIPHFVWIMRPDGSCDYCNRRWCDYTNMTPQQTQGDGWLQSIHPDDRKRTLAAWQSAVQTSMPYEVEYRVQHGTTGDYRWFLARGAPLKDAQGTILKWFGTSTDIDDRKQAEQRLKESREHLRVLAETVPQLVWNTGPDGLTEDWNQRYADYFQATPEQLRGYGWRQFLHPEEYDHVCAVRDRSLATGDPYEIEYRLKDGKTGSYRWFIARALPVRDEAGQIVKWFGTCTDIDEQKRTEQQLKESEENWRVLAETLPQLVVVARPDGWHEYANQRWHDYTGLTVEQTQSDRWAYLQFIHPDDREGALTHQQHAQDTGTMYEHEERLRNSQTGAYRWFLTRGVPVRDEAGQMVKWFGTCTDIDEQKRTEEALRQSQEQVRALMNSSIIGIFASVDEQVVDANDTYLRMTGYTREDLRAESINWLNMTPPEYLARTQQARQELVGQRYGTPYEKEYICKDGSRLPVVVGVVALRPDPLYTIGFVLDNSARQELEQRKDDFISMAGHELRTPLTALKLQTALLKKQLAKQGSYDPAAAFAKMEAQVNRAIGLVGELLDVSKIRAGRLEYAQEPVDLDALLREITDTMQQINPSHRIVVRGAVQSSLIGDRDRLGQVFTNLLSNAIKYSPDAQTVEIDLDASPETVTIRVHDHGLGIPREQRDKIFERFYRAAGPKQRVISGLGMGLYIVAEIVKRHGGTITVDSEVGRGSTFTVTLPRKRDA